MQLTEAQQHAVDFLIEKKHAALFSPMGFGKTAIALNTISQLRETGQIRRALVVAPLRVAQTTWPNEMHKWTPHLRHVRAIGIRPLRIKACRFHDVDVTIINRDNVTWLCNEVANGQIAWQWDAVIVDESTSFKAWKSQRTKALVKLAAKAKYRVIMSGTPAPNSLMDLWSQYAIIDDTRRLGESFWKFRERYFYISNAHSFKYIPRPTAPATITNAVRPLTLSPQYADSGITMPNKLNLIRRTQLNADAMRQYKLLESDFYVAISDTERCNVVHAGTLSGKLRQMANGSVYHTPQNGTVRQTANIHDDKLDELAGLIEDNPSENFLVAYSFHADKEKIKRRFPNAVALDSEKHIDDFAKGKIRIAIAHPASVGHGLNLQNNCAIVVWYGMPWSLELYEQFNGRVFRQGQMRTVRIVHIIAEDTIDERIVEALKQKARTQEDLLNYLRSRSGA